MALQEYKCVRKCYFGKGPTVEGKAPTRRVYAVGDTEAFDPDVEKIPAGKLGPHFIPLVEHKEVPPEEAARAFQKAVMKGVRAPVDKDKLLEQAKRKFSPVDAHKDDFFGDMPKKKK